MADSAPPQQADPQDLGEAFRVYDEPVLAALSDDDLLRQVRARETVWLYVDEIWHQVNSQGPDALADPRFAAVVMLRELMGELYERADTVFLAGGED
jgi:hypothetical protein